MAKSLLSTPRNNIRTTSRYLLFGAWCVLENILLVPPFPVVSEFHTKRRGGGGHSRVYFTRLHELTSDT